jgi:hypothetical protein
MSAGPWQMRLHALGINGIGTVFAASVSNV